MLLWLRINWDAGRQAYRKSLQDEATDTSKIKQGGLQEILRSVPKDARGSGRWGSSARSKGCSGRSELDVRKPLLVGSARAQQGNPRRRTQGERQQ